MLDSLLTLLSDSGVWKQIYCRNSQNIAPNMAKTWPNIVVPIGHNIDMSLSLIGFSPENFTSLVCLELYLQVMLVK